MYKMANRWIEFVRKWSAKAGISYACAVSKPECRAEYQAKYGNRKNLPRKTEREMMGQEDVRSQAVRDLEKKKKIVKKKPALIIEGEEEYIITPKKKEKKPKRSQKAVAAERVSPKLKPVMERLKALQENIQSQMAQKKEMTASLRGKLAKELKTVLDEKKRLVELSRMMGQDYNVNEKKIPVKEAIKENIETLKKKGNASLLKLAKALNPKTTKDGKFVEDNDITFGGEPTWRSLRIDKLKNFWLFSSLDEWVGVLKQNGKHYFFKDDEYPSKEAEKYYKDVMEVALKKKWVGNKTKYLKELYKEDDEPAPTPALKKKAVPALKKKAEPASETEEQVYQHLLNTATQYVKDSPFYLKRMRDTARERVKAGFTIEDEKAVRKLSREEIRVLFRDYIDNPSIGTLVDGNGDFYDENKAPKNLIISYLFGDDYYDRGDIELDWKKMKEGIMAVKNVETKGATKQPIKIPYYWQNFLKETIGDYLFQHQVLELSRTLGIIPSKKDTKVDTIPTIIKKLEEGVIDFNDLFKGIRQIEKRFNNEKAVLFIQGKFKPTTSQEESQALSFGLKKRTVPFGIPNFTKNFGNPDDPTDYNAIWINKMKENPNLYPVAATPAPTPAPKKKEEDYKDVIEEIGALISGDDSLATEQEKEIARQAVQRLKETSNLDAAYSLAERYSKEGVYTKYVKHSERKRGEPSEIIDPIAKPSMKIYKIFENKLFRLKIREEEKKSIKKLIDKLKRASEEDISNLQDKLKAKHPEDFVGEKLSKKQFIEAMSGGFLMDNTFYIKKIPKMMSKRKKKADIFGIEKDDDEDEDEESEDEEED